MIAVWPLSGFSKKCVDEKTSVERSQSRTGNSIVLGILQVSVNLFQESYRKEMSEFDSLIQVVSSAEILCWSFLERINYFSFDLCVCVQNLHVCF